MATLDVEFLFTNIQLNETINNCIIDLHSKNLYNGKFSKRDLFKLLKTATLANQLLFLITCFINKLKEWQWFLLWIPPLQMHFYAIMKKNGWIIVQSILKLWYTKDMLMIFLFFFHFFFHFQHLQLFVDYMNKQHKCPKFTSEAENDNSFSFLDIKITHHNQQFKTSVYRKPTFSGVFTHYESYVTQTYKKTLTDTLLFHCFSICSDYTSLHLEAENLKEILKKNSYPSGIIEQSIRSFLNKLHVPKKVIPTVPKNELFIVLTYLECYHLI